MNAMNEKISAIGVVPVIKLNHPERDAAGLAKALCDGDVPVAEVTFRAAGADKAIRIMKECCPDMLVGAGTVTNTAQIDAVIAAGGDFIVSPGFDPELVAYAQEKEIPIYPGCTTASEYHQALKFGLEVIKFFPAEQSGGLAKYKIGIIIPNYNYEHTIEKCLTSIFKQTYKNYEIIFVDDMSTDNLEGIRPSCD